jgi:hypothetical protein
MRTAMLAACVFVAIAAGAQAQQAPAAQPEPFGFKQGMTKAEIIAMVGEKSVAAVDGDVLVLTSAPNSNPAIDKYWVIVSDTTGLAKVQVTTKNVKTNSFGEALQGEFKGLQATLENQYGEVDTIDSLQPGSAWDDPRDWMTGLMHDERALAAVWKLEGISILEQAVALSSSEGYVRVVYEFPNFHTWKQDHEERKSSRL